MKVENISIFFVNIFLVVTFPLYLIYSYGYAINYLPRIPPIGYPIFIHTCSLGMLFIIIINSSKVKKSLYLLLFIYFIVVCIIYLLSGFLFSNYAWDLEVFLQTFLFVFYLIIYSILGYYLIKFNRVFNFWGIFLLIISLLILYNFMSSGNYVFNIEQINPNIKNLGYQNASFIVMFTWFIYYYFSDKDASELKKTLSAFLVFIILLLSGGRSELLGFIIAFSYMAIINLLNTRFKSILNSLLYLIPFTLILIYFSDFVVDIFENSRHFKLLDIENDTSWQAREETLNYNLSYIKNNWFLGSYGSHFEIGSGEYIHNLLSAWQQFGLVGFSLYLFLVVYPPIILTINKLNGNKDPIINPVLFFSLYSLIMVLSAKSVFWEYVGISIGLYIYMSIRQKKYD